MAQAKVQLLLQRCSPAAQPWRNACGEISPPGAGTSYYGCRCEGSRMARMGLQERGDTELAGDRFESRTDTPFRRRSGFESLAELDEVEEIEGVSQLFDSNVLMDKFVKCGNVEEAHRVFDGMPQRNVVSWNVMILGYAKKEEGALALDLYARMEQEGVEPNERTFVGVLKACSNLATLEEGTEVDGKIMKIECLEKGRAIHLQLVKAGFQANLYVGTSLVDMYVKCGSMVDAQDVFDRLPHRDVVSWNAMIFGHPEREVALQLYAQMQLEGVVPNARSFVGALKACSGLSALEDGKQVDGKFVKAVCLAKGKAIHTLITKYGFESNLFVANTLIDTYAKCGSIVDAWHVFDKLPHRGIVSWNAMILGCGMEEEGAVALLLYARMQQEGVKPDDRTLVGALKACSSLAALEDGEQRDGNVLKIRCLTKCRAIHSEAVKNGFESNVFVGTALVDLYAKCGSMEDAWHVFDKLPCRDVVSWNALILGYAEKQEGEVALQLYAQLQQEGIIPDDRTFVGTLKACKSLAKVEEGGEVGREFVKIGCLEKGRDVHAQMLKSAFTSDVLLGTTLVDMYAKCGSMEDAWYVFESLPHHDVVSWNAMIVGYADKGRGEMALQLFARMQQEGVAPNDRTFVGALRACNSLAASEEATYVDGKFVKKRFLMAGRAIHSLVVKSGFVSNTFVMTTLVNMYVKCGSMKDARHLFDKLPLHDVGCWNAMVLGYVEQSEYEEAFELYARMQELGLTTYSWTYVGILKACGSTASLAVGKEVHGQICRAGLESTSIVASSLIDMYSKCGSMVDAQQLLDVLPKRDLVTWSALISGYAHQGENEAVFDLFDRIIQEGLQPDGVTFLSVLMVCSHVGLVYKGQSYFESMSQGFGIAPGIEHYNCMVDLLGRAGQLGEAVEMIETMPFQPTLVMWRSLLGACRKWNNVETGTHAFERAVRLDEKHAAAYVLMSNIYADACMWDGCDNIQTRRMKVWAWKTPGCSWWTDMHGSTHTFMVGDKTHTQSKDIYAKLMDLSMKLEEQGPLTFTGHESH